jgi:adenosylcobyric acid synthase
MPARTLMVQGTGSDVGKSVLVAALCRLFLGRGLRVAPFKAQNMSNNSFVTPDGREIGRAQAVQAAACRLSPRSDFNPVLIKPSAECSAQLIVNGKVAGSLVASDFGRVRRECWGQVQDAFARLVEEFDLIILEGAGSPAEVNLREHDIVNMRMARHAGAPVILVGDIDRGGVLAAVVGTMALLSDEEAELVKGFVINKFRGDAELLTPGLKVVETRTGLPCLGVLPYFRDLRLPEEDAVPWKAVSRRPANRPDVLTIGVADVPCISNFTDLDRLRAEGDVELVRISGPEDILLDALILPGTKNTPQALRYLQDCGIDRIASRILAEGGTVVGLCGGYQLLGKRILDPHQIESTEKELKGLGLLDVETTFGPEKVTVQVTGIHRGSGSPIEGYEVHMGQTVRGKGVEPLFDIQNFAEAEARTEGAVSGNGRVMGTYVHGVFDSSAFRRCFLNRLRSARGWSPVEPQAHMSLDRELDRWADYVGRYLNLAALETIISGRSLREYPNH